MSVYSVGGRCRLGLILAGNMMVKAYYYSPLNNKDLSEIRDLVHAMKVLNIFIHSHCSEMSDGFRSTLPIVRSRLSSVASTPSYYASGSTHYNHMDQYLGNNYCNNNECTGVQIPHRYMHAYNIAGDVSHASLCILPRMRTFSMTTLTI